MEAVMMLLFACLIIIGIWNTFRGDIHARRLTRLEKELNIKPEMQNKNNLQGAAEYDRLRDEEFRELGWTGKY